MAFCPENANFSRICGENDIKFIGASPEMIDAMGDKASAKATMKAAGVPTIPGSEGILADFDEAKACAHDIGYPIMLKATAGGGGKGMRVCQGRRRIAEGWESTRREAGAAFGNDGMYMEKFVVEPRHIEIQIASDYRGKACHLSERDCSIQRRHQKLVEETPSPYMTDKLREAMGEAAIKAAEAVKYEGVGTVEFLVDANRDFYFMEMNTRIQVEHTITEEVIDYDLIKEQIKLAAGEKISGRNHFPKLHSIQCRINAEDPDRNWAPSPGSHHGLPRTGRTRGSGGHPRLRRVHDSSALRQHDQQADCGGPNPRGGHHQDATRARRVHHRRRQDDHPLPSAIDEEPALPRRRLHHQVLGRGERLINTPCDNQTPDFGRAFVRSGGSDFLQRGRGALSRHQVEWPQHDLLAPSLLHCPPCTVGSFWSVHAAS